MIDKKNIKWACCQPLTGGMYLGTEKAIGHPAEFILSFPGLNAVDYNKDGSIKNAGNEYHFLKYLQSVNRLPEYKLIDKQNMFEMGPVTGVKLLNDPDWSTDKEIDFSDIDIVTAVPVCSGLSMATTKATSDEHRDSRNCNMEWLARYVLENIKPKIYIFENAPGLFTARGEKVRTNLNQTAKEYGYSLAYYKTDTKYHGVPQLRPRTFVMFIKYRGEDTGCPELMFNHEECKTFAEFLAEIPDDAPQQQEYVKMNVNSTNILGFMKHKFGDNWRKDVIEKERGRISDFVRHNNLVDEYLDYVKPLVDDRIFGQIQYYFQHIKDKEAMGMGYYETMVHICPKDIAPAVIFKNMFTLLNPTQDRLLSMRECLKLMGHPDDFIIYGSDFDKCRKIGQNVPVNTARWIVSEAVRIVENWDTVKRDNSSIGYFDNTNFKIRYIEKQNTNDKQMTIPFAE